MFSKKYVKELIYLIEIFVMSLPYIYIYHHIRIQLILNSSLLTMFYLNTIVTKNIFQFFFF